VTGFSVWAIGAPGHEPTSVAVVGVARPFPWMLSGLAALSLFGASVWVLRKRRAR